MSHSRLVSWSPAALVATVVAVLPLPAAAQEADGAAPKAEGEGGRPAFDSGALWKLIETYRPAREKEHATAPGALGQYKVTFEEVVKITGDNPGGAPTLKQSVTLGRYYELADQVEATDERVLSVVRRYDGLKRSIDPKVTPKLVPGTAGANFWIAHRPEVLPLVIALDPSKDFRFDAYHLIAAQVFLPDLTLLLPVEGSVRVGESYPISREGSVALVGSLGWLGIEGQKLQGKLVQVRPGAAGKPWQATIDIVGDNTVAGIHAELTFVFEPPAADELAKAGGKDDTGTVIHAYGAIVEIRMVTRMTLPRPDRRLKDNVERTLLLRRSRAEPGDPIAVPEPPPEPNPENSWLTFIDPQGHYHLRIPQTLIYDNHNATANADTATFYRPTPDRNSQEDLAIQWDGNSGLSPRDALDQTLAQIRAAGLEVATQPPGPSRTWVNLRADFRQARIRDPNTLKDDSETFFAFAIRGPGNFGIVARARTANPNPADFRALVESILKTLKPGVPKDR